MKRSRFDVSRIFEKIKLQFFPYKKIDINKIERLEYLWNNIPTQRVELNIWSLEVSDLIDEVILSRISKKDLSLIFAGLSSYSVNGATSEITQNSLVEAFCNSSTMFQEMLHQILYRKNDILKDVSVPFSNLLGSMTSLQVAATINSLNTYGYAILPVKLDEVAINRTKNESLRFKYIVRDPIDRKSPYMIDGINVDCPPLCNTVSALPDSLQSSEVFSEIIQDPLIRYIAAIYLQSSVDVIASPLWYSFPGNCPSDEGAQLFHYDLDTIRWLKVFYFLTDVNNDTGPHVFVPGTHRPGIKSQELLNKKYNRISDREIREYQKEEIINICGEAGTIVVGDTRCYHKGLPLKRGHRIMFSPIYSPSKFGFFHGFD